MPYEAPQKHVVVFCFFFVIYGVPDTSELAALSLLEYKKKYFADFKEGQENGRMNILSF